MADNPNIPTTKGGNVVHPRVERGLRKLGEDISLARRARKMTAQDFADRIGISRATLHRLEGGDPGIGINTLAMALHALGRLDALIDIADPARDVVTMMQLRDAVPRRVGKAWKSAKTEGVEVIDKADGKFVGF
ncbi:helix-turn-helix domain-containing protein [Shinella sp. CPCC 101442]|uniref:helix-turn-helix domain-containing protein n=1 Tax=Shinella sp. CPCC 101442 TaxID=2932265 RepID=UPI0021535153|nr:helix-turn-helix transcriptional regulator [Shinella sp. CPCC 101442]MCR6502512.1 helix-turn-helix domain-containing protein [Shinella sp. CPCC 101442]